MNPGIYTRRSGIVDDPSSDSDSHESEVN